MNHDKMNASELVRHIVDNYEEITGWTKDDMFNEGHFPEPIMELIEEHGVDQEEFDHEWLMKLEALGSDHP